MVENSPSGPGYIFNCSRIMTLVNSDPKKIRFERSNCKRGGRPVGGGEGTAAEIEVQSPSSDPKEGGGEQSARKYLTCPQLDVGQEDEEAGEEGAEIQQADSDTRPL